jgi:hypothetical protein
MKRSEGEVLASGVVEGVWFDQSFLVHLLLLEERLWPK